MIALLLIAIAAGAASALMFASIVSGALISLLLVYLAPLPLMVVALGWGPLAAAFGGIAAALGLVALLGLPFSIAFVFAVALPAWWLGHLAMLGRRGAAAPAANSADLEWYPVGRILIWIAAIATLTTAGVLLSFGTDVEAIADTMRQGMREMTGQTDAQMTPEQIELFVKAFMFIAPVAMPLSVMLTLTLNLWLAARVALTSGRLHRPWPDLRSAALPLLTLATLSVAIAFSFVGGLSAMLALTVVTALLFAYAVVGFAVLHVLTLSASNRTFWLTSAYAVTFLFSGLIVVMALLGITDALFGVRQRFLRSRPPPLPAS